MSEPVVKVSDLLTKDQISKMRQTFAGMCAYELDNILYDAGCLTDEIRKRLRDLHHKLEERAWVDLVKQELT